jgi:uncharacterized protein
MPSVTAKRLLVFDAPNIDMTLSHLLGAQRRPSRDERPDLAALARWFVADVENAGGSEAAVFLNVSRPETGIPAQTAWVHWLRGQGFRVFVKPKLDGSDIDDEMLAYVAGLSTGDVAVVASNDARNFLVPLEQLAERGVTVTVLGFREQAGPLPRSDKLRFVDLEAVPGLFKQRIAGRTILENLPPAGVWLEPLAPLGGASAGEEPEVDLSGEG